MSLQRLRDALLEMPPTGAEGFEGLVATLLSALTGDRFYIARSGDQPTDAVSSAADIAIQAKRYDETRFSETEFEGEYHRACRSFPQLDCYVFAATRTTTQLVALANELQNREGVDIFLLEFEKLDSELASLCLRFWDKIKDFPKLADLGSQFARWALQEAERAEAIAAVERLRGFLTTSIPLAGPVKRKLKSYLDVRFGIDLTSGQAVRFPIDLPSSVERPILQQSLNQWWKGEKSRAALLIGDEGMGKSVVAAAFGDQIIETSAALVLWLDSVDWAGILTIEGIVNEALKRVGFTDRALRERLTRKAMTRWSSKLLVVLDGVNEKSARDAAHRLLAELQAAETRVCRLLFTSRRIQWRSDESALWKTTQEIPVSLFTDEELNNALASLPDPIPRMELPVGLVEVAKIPRYMQIEFGRLQILQLFWLLLPGFVNRANVLG